MLKHDNNNNPLTYVRFLLFMNSIKLQQNSKKYAN